MVEKEKLAGFEGNMDPNYLVWSGIVYDGVLYYKPCKTPYGDYPFLENMRLGVWSATKSIGPGLGMLRLAEKYGPYVFNLKIRDYVEMPASHNGWEDVTFGNLLNMTSGIGGGTNKADAGMSADYLDKTYDAWYVSPSAKGKLAKIAESGNYPWGPGEVARYRDRDMFTLGAAMDAFLKSMEGPDADIWNMIAEEIFKPIHIYHAPTTRTIEPDGKLGLPLMAWGWFPSMDDVAKVADLLHRRGNYNGKQILNLEKTMALFSVEGSFDKHNSLEYGPTKYKMAYHYFPFPDHTGAIMYCPYMAGWIGNRILLLPGQMTAIRMSKAWPAPDEVQKAADDPTSMAKVASRLKPFLRFD
jgi:CubicO group peptidase (beta-lactamase class C family)